MNNNFIFAIIALKTFISQGIPTNKLNKCVVYHYTPKKLPNIDVIKKNAIDLKSGQFRTARNLKYTTLYMYYFILCNFVRNFYM